MDHGILCKKLYLYGIQNRELAWFKSYLANRKQFARVNGADSKIEEIDIGVPEDSRAIGFLKYARQYLPITAVKTLYPSIVKPHFQYCCSVWGCCSAAEIQHLQRL